MGISVSVDSWVQQTIEQLIEKEYPEKDPIYQRLLTSASMPSEILILEYQFFEGLINSESGNFDRVINVCVSGLSSPSPNTCVNAAALLQRVFPLLSTSDSPVRLNDLLMKQRMIEGREVTPGLCILETGVMFLRECPETMPVKSYIEGVASVFDLMGLVIFVMLKRFHDRTLLDEMIGMMDSEVIAILLDYVNAGGRCPSIIAVLTMLAFHSKEFTVETATYIGRGGSLSGKLVNCENDETDVLCMLCAVSLLGDDVRPPLSSRDPNVTRLALLKVMMNKTVESTPEEIAAAFECTKSPLARAVMARVTVPIAPETARRCEPLTDTVFTELRESTEMMEWIRVTVAHLFTFAHSYLFLGTSGEPIHPVLDAIDTLIVQSV